MSLFSCRPESRGPRRADVDREALAEGLCGEGFATCALLARVRPAPDQTQLEVADQRHGTEEVDTNGERLAALCVGYESKITLHGAYANDALPDILGGMDVLVVPSLWYEAFGLTLREAFLAGVPVVTANHGAMAEVVEDGRSGLLFEAGDAASLADALRRLADDPELRVRLAAGAPPVRDERDAAHELLGIYDRLIAEGSRANGDRP